MKKGSGLGIAAVIGVFLVIIVGVALMPTIADQTIGISGTGNITGVSATLLDLVPLFFVIGLVTTTLLGMKVRG